MIIGEGTIQQGRHHFVILICMSLFAKSHSDIADHDKKKQNYTTKYASYSIVVKK